MIKTDAIVMLCADSEKQVVSSYHSGEPADVITLLAAAGMNDPAFGEMIIHASLVLCDELQKREINWTPAEVEKAKAKKERRDRNLKILLRKKD